MHVDYPVADYEPMAATALTDEERWPLLTPDAEAMLTGLRDTPGGAAATTTRAATA